MKSFLKQIFSVENDSNCHKIITILGIKLKFYNKNKILKILKNESMEIKNNIYDLKWKLEIMNKDQVCTFQYLTGIELNNNFVKEREIVFSPNDVPSDHYNRYAFAVKNVSENDVVADVACTCGYGSFMLGQKAKRVIGVDINQPVINFANKVYASDKIKFLCQNAQELDLPEEIDMLVSFETIEHIPNPELFLKKAFSFLKENGRLICSVPNETTRPWAKEGNPFHYRHYTKEQLVDLLEKCGFKIQDIYQQYFDNDYTIEQRPEEGGMLIAIAVKK